MAKKINGEIKIDISKLTNDEISKEVINFLDVLFSEHTCKEETCSCEECSCEDEPNYAVACEANKDALLFEAITREMLDIYKAKNKDYGNSFKDTFDKIGPKSAATRILDKANRFANLCDKDIEESEVGESLIDTLTDLANYSVMTIMVLMQH